MSVYNLKQMVVIVNYAKRYLCLSPEKGLVLYRA